MSTPVVSHNDTTYDVEIDNNGGGVHHNGRLIGWVKPDKIAGRTVWKATTVDGRSLPEYGNKARKTRAGAAQLLAQEARRV